VAAPDVRLTPGVDGALWAASLLVLAVFGLGLLLAAANVATLFLARALGRRREIATRLALGAARWQLVRQLFLEGLLLALAGGVLGLLVARLSNDWLGRVDSPLVTVGWPLDLVLAPALDARVVGFALAATIATAVVCALFPALAATRSDLGGMLREIAAGAATGSGRRLRAALVAAQVAVAVVLLAAAGAALRSLIDAERLHPGFDARGVAVVTLSPDLLGYRGAAADRLFARVDERVSALPGVHSVAFASHLPLTLAINFGAPVAPQGGDPQALASSTAVDFASVGPGYFATMRIPIVAGREFAASDDAGARRVVILNETLARHLWPGAAALGRRLRDGAEVVGIARDGKYRTLGERPRPFLYRSLGQDPRGTRTLVIRTAAADPRPLLPAIRRAVREVDPRVPLGGPRTLAEAAADALLLPRLAAGLLGFFGALGLGLAAIGVFGVIAYLASARTREIGLRLALGASRGALLRWLLYRGLAPVAVGLAAGVTAAATLSRALADVFTGAWPLDLDALLAATALLALAALAAALAPARHAVTLDPAAALRHE
jgi:predicted permease